jgi:hypothetical protein
MSPEFCFGWGHVAMQFPGTSKGFRCGAFMHGTPSQAFAQHTRRVPPIGEHNWGRGNFMFGVNPSLHNEYYIHVLPHSCFSNGGGAEDGGGHIAARSETFAERVVERQFGQAALGLHRQTTHE